MMTVSPFDGANRIRFKGSPGLGIAEFGLRIFKNAALESTNHKSFGLSAVNRYRISVQQVFNPHSEITNRQSIRLPRNLFCCQCDLNSRTVERNAQPVVHRVVNFTTPLRLSGSRCLCVGLFLRIISPETPRSTETRRNLNLGTTVHQLTHFQSLADGRISPHPPDFRIEIVVNEGVAPEEGDAELNRLC